MPLLLLHYHHHHTLSCILLILLSTTFKTPTSSFVSIPINKKVNLNILTPLSSSSSSISLFDNASPVKHQLPTQKRKESSSVTIDRKKVGMYIHIPYCRQRCRYCNFSIIPIGRNTKEAGGDTENEVNMNQTLHKKQNGFLSMDESYLTAVLQEIQLLYDSTTKQQKENNGTTAIVSSIYIGGGTPTLAPIQTIRSILKEIRRFFPFDSDDNEIEITMEMDPGTFTLKQLQEYKTIGINRVSLGIQSFDNELLSYMGRTHTFQDITSSLSLLKQVYGGDTNLNFSIDLISGLPGLTLQKWKETLEYATHIIKPNHISVYDLQLEYGTIFGKWYLQQEAENSNNIILHNDSYTLPTSEESASMYRYASKYLQRNNYEHYEISSYALNYQQGSSSDSTNDPTSYRSKHNNLYWKIDAEWYGIGLSAASSINNHRYTRPNTLSDYRDWVTNQTMTNDIPDFLLQTRTNDTTQIISNKQEYLYDIILTRLRTSDGLDLKIIQHRYGKEVVNCILSSLQYMMEEELDLVTIGGDRNGDGDWILQLNDPNGFLVSNTILSTIFADLDDFFMDL